MNTAAQGSTLEQLPLSQTSNRFFAKMVTCLVALLLCCSALATSTAAHGQAPATQEGASEPTLEQVLAKHYEALGGLEKLRALQSLRVTGRLTTQGAEIPFTMERRRPNKFRMTLSFQGLEILQVYDGELAWGVNPLAGRTKPGPMPEGEAMATAKQATFDSVLVDPKGQGAELALAGREPLGDGEAFKILVSYEGGVTDTAFLDADTYLETRRLAHATNDGQEVEVAITFDEYREVEGVQMVAKQTNLTPMGPAELAFEKFEAGVDIDDELFLMPGQEADPSLDLEQILSRHLTARSRPEAAKIQTVRATGNLTLMGFQLPLEMSFARPSSTRLKADMQGMTMILAYDGETAWTVSPMQGIPEPETMPEEAEEAIALFSEFLWGLLADHEAKGYQLELAGIEKVGRDQTYKLILTTKSGDRRELYLGGEDFLEHKVHLETVFMGLDQAIDALLSDYQSTEGLLVPRKIELLADGNPQGGVSLEKVEVNVELDPTIFLLPVKPTAEAPPAP